jgi:hypothetical protein
MMQPGEADRAYVDCPVTDLVAADRAARIAADHWALAPTPELLRAGMNAIHAAGSVVLRVAAPTVDAVAALRLHRFLAEVGVRVPVPHVPTSSRSTASASRAGNVCAASSAPTDWRAVGAMVRAVHRLDPGVAAPVGPVAAPGQLPLVGLRRTPRSAPPTSIDAAARTRARGGRRTPPWLAGRAG